MEWDDVRNVLILQDIFHFDVNEFVNFIHPVKCTMWRQEALGCKISFLFIVSRKASWFDKKNEEVNPLPFIGFRLGRLEDMFWDMIRQRRVAFFFLIVGLSKMSRDYPWILEHIEMLREGKDKKEELYKMFICDPICWKNHLSQLDMWILDHCKAIYFCNLRINKKTPGPLSCPKCYRNMVQIIRRMRSTCHPYT
ncbi:hypothetical protein H5410_045163 [Solanum commersonii]|uniref:Uncharacterized protein n=1 Tax=Solanum commersonii TaxID=4109 RepID=A0A9J5X8S6_SOLCO|nr:hypothetical protein H5410_045163 [Solanum commersonii]